MLALALHRDAYGPPAEVLGVEQLPAPRLHPEDAGRVLVAVLATGANFNTNFAALGLPVPVFGRGDAATVHVPGSDALGIVVDAGSAVTAVKVGQAVILDSWNGRNLIRGYELHDGFNAQLAVVDEVRAIPVPPSLSGCSPEQLAAVLLTHGTAYRCVVERLRVGSGDSLLLMGGGKGTSFAGAQMAKALGARVILVGSNPELGDSLVRRGMADAFIDRRRIPAEVFGPVAADEDHDSWIKRTEPFRRAVLEANRGRPVDKVFEHTGGRNFPLLVSALADPGTLCFFGATGSGVRGEYKETFFYHRRRLVIDARWVWMRQKQILFRKSEPGEIFREIGLTPGRKGVIWGADAYALSFARAALQRRARLAVIASFTQEREGLAELARLGIAESHLIDRDGFELEDDMPDPLNEQGTANPAYGAGFMSGARALGKAIWKIFGPRTSPDFIVERTDQSTLHYSSFLLRDHDERDEMSCGYIVIRGLSDLSILGSHMYRDSQARDTIRLLGSGDIVMEQDDLDLVSLRELPRIQQKMLDGTMEKPKGVALVQANRSGRPVAEYEDEYLGKILRRASAGDRIHLDLRLVSEVGLITLSRPEALNALSEELVSQLDEVVRELESRGTLEGHPVKALIIRGAGRAFVAGADVNAFLNKDAAAIEQLASSNMSVFDRLENLELPVVSLADGFALGGGNELMMSTRYRIVTENAAIGQPEIKLGIIPGYGGMQRLPRLVGPRRAAEMAVNGEAVSGREAVGLGLADEFHPSSTALRRAYRVATELASGERAIQRRQWDEMAARQQKELDTTFKSEQVAELLSAPAPDAEAAQDLAIARRYAARIALSALREGYSLGFAAGLRNDARLFALAVTAASGQHWIRRFLAKDPAQSSFLTLLPPDGSG